MITVKLTSKRQATFPVQTCRELGVGPGDDLVLERRQEADGTVLWALKPAARPARPWLGSLRKYAAGKPHDMASIRASIERGRAAES